MVSVIHSYDERACMLRTSDIKYLETFAHLTPGASDKFMAGPPIRAASSSGNFVATFIEKWPKPTKDPTKVAIRFPPASNSCAIIPANNRRAVLRLHKPGRLKATEPSLCSCRLADARPGCRNTY